MRALEAFLAAVDPARRAEASSVGLGSQLTDVITAARAEWPTLSVDEERFAALLGERLPSDVAVADGLASLRGGDLWIVCGCAASDPRSIAAFEREFFNEISAAVRRVANASLSEDDVAQLVREKLFVGSATARPKILDYRGLGPVRAWLRVTASRVALNLVTRGTAREQPADGEWFARVIADGDHPEAAHLKSKYRADFRVALEAAVGALDPKDRNVLAYAFGEQLSIDQIGGIYGVHRATAARWVASAQKRLVDETRSTLARRLGASPADVDSIVHLIASRFDVSLGRVLGEGEKANESGE